MQTTLDLSHPKIEALLAEMTLEEKAGQLTQSPNMESLTDEDVELGRVGSVICSASAYAGNEKQERVRAAQTNKMQRIAVEKSRLKIPLVFARDVIHGHRTVGPIPIGQAASFDPKLSHDASVVAAKEASADGIRWAFTPMLDIARDPRWGRIAEGFGEDPYLAARFAEAVVRGLQGDDISSPERVAACAKHFVGYGAAEGGRDYNTCEISDYTLRNIYLEPFRAAVKAGLATVMSAFNEIGGTPITAHKRILREILKDEWGFDGVVVSDWGAVGELIEHGVAEDNAEAARLALTAGVDIDMAANAYLQRIPELVRTGRLDVSVVDDAVRRVLSLKMALGLFEKPYTDEKRADVEMFTPEHQQTVLELARRTPILLKNEGGVLPLKPDAKTAVFGPHADSQDELFGTWTLDGLADDAISIKQALKKLMPKANIEESKHTDEAINKGRFLDAAVVVVGEIAWRSGEANSVTDIGLPAGQLDMLKGFHRMQVPVIAVVIAGRPLDLSWLIENCAAVLFCFHPGVMGGQAIAEILAGKTGPSGRLPVCLPRHVGQIPYYYNHKATGRPLDYHGRGLMRYVDSPDSPLFPFGYGLTYSSFEYGSTEVKETSNGWEISATVKNVGGVDAEEVPQLYIRDEVASMTRPIRELKGFERLTFKAGESKKVAFKLSKHDLGFYNIDEQWVTEPGGFTAWVAPNAFAGDPARFSVE